MEDHSKDILQEIDQETLREINGGVLINELHNLTPDNARGIANAFRRIKAADNAIFEKSVDGAFNKVPGAKILEGAVGHTVGAARNMGVGHAAGKVKEGVKWASSLIK